MAYPTKPKTRAVIPTPQGVTADIAKTIVDSKIEFFTKVFSQATILEHQKQVYSTIINSPDASGFNIEQQLGSENAKIEMSRIMFHLTTGASHT